MKINRAISFAVWKHRKQMRKGTNLPYIVHPLAVMNALINFKCSEDVIIGGVLHDILEDTNTSYLELRLRFGKRVADIVKGCSENKKLSWKERKQETIDKMMNPVDYDVFMVELADKYCNLVDIFIDCDKPNFWKRFKVSKKSLGWYYKGLGKAIKKYSDENNRVFETIAISFNAMYKYVFERRK